jgi:hypothetical protein
MHEQFVEASSKAQSLQEELDVMRSLAFESERNLGSPLRELALNEVRRTAQPRSRRVLPRERQCVR